MMTETLMAVEPHDLTCTPQANFVDSPAHRALSKRFGRPLRGTNARLELAAERHQGPADDDRF